MSAYDRQHPNQAGGEPIQYNQPWRFDWENTLILVTAGHGLYRRLWAARVCSAQWRTLIRSWATPPTTRDIQIEWGGEPIQYNQPWIFAQLGGGAAAAAWQRRGGGSSAAAAVAAQRQQHNVNNNGATGDDNDDNADGMMDDKVDDNDGNGAMVDDINVDCDGVMGDDNDDRTTDNDVNNDGDGATDDGIEDNCNGATGGRHCLEACGGCARKGDARRRPVTTGDATSSRRTRCKWEKRHQRNRGDLASIGRGCVLRGGGRVERMRGGGINLPTRNGSP